uniref:Uncharacterized protein n=1 Tax=viral metagenome TaxID=1070528 RepID=A0A6C0KAQ3_9ZZZZ
MILFKELILRMSKVKNISTSLINIFLLINWKKENMFHIFKHSILEEEFITEPDKETLMDLYISVKKIMNRLNSIARLYKYKKAVKYDIDTDLHLNLLEQLPNNEKISIIENNTLYNFKLRDLISCWKLALLNSQGLFAKPIELKNPYTNLPFKKHNLYNIYFKCLNMYINLPMCITTFFKCNMTISKYQLYYYTTLKEVAIINFLNANNYYELFEQVLNLLHDYRKEVDYLTFTNYCSITARTKAVKNFKPMLLNYLLSKFSCNPIVRDQKLKQLKKQLKDYVKESPEFGFERGFDVMRYVPLAERPSRTNPPPPPPNLVSQIRNRRGALRRRIIRSTFNDSFSESDSDDTSLDIVENVIPPINVTIPATPPPAVISTPPPPPPVVISTPSPPPPPVVIYTPPPPAPTVVISRPTHSPPPPPVIDTQINPFVSRNQIPRTPVNRVINRTPVNRVINRTPVNRVINGIPNLNNNANSSRENIRNLNNNLQLNVNSTRNRNRNRNMSFGLNYLR